MRIQTRRTCTPWGKSLKPFASQPEASAGVDGECKCKCEYVSELECRVLFLDLWMLCPSVRRSCLHALTNSHDIRAAARALPSPAAEIAE